MALFACTGSLVSCARSWLASYSPSDLTFVVVRQPIAPHAKCHHQLFERRVAGALADAVDRALDLARAALDRRDAVGDGESEIVVAVRAEDGLVGVGHALNDVREEFARFVRRGVANGVRQVDGRAALANDRFDDATQKIAVGARGILRRKFHIVGELTAEADRRHRRVEARFARHAQLGLQVQIGRGEERVNPRPFGRLQRPGRLFDILRARPRQRGNHGAPQFARNLLEGVRIGRRGDGKARFDDVHAQRVEGARHGQLGRHVHREAGGLLAVAERRVEDDYARGIAHGFCSSR